MSNGTLTLAKKAVSGQIQMTAVATDLASLIAAELNIEPSSVYYVDDLTPQSGAFTWSCQETDGLRYAGADWALKKPKTVNNGHKTFVVAGGNIDVDFLAYIE